MVRLVSGRTTVRITLRAGDFMGTHTRDATMTIKRLIFIRHGESEHHVNGMTGGWTDTPLTERGRRQAAATARHLAELDLAAAGFFTSDLLRASQTAEIIGEQLHRQADSLISLREVNNGEATGLTVLEAKKIERPHPPTYDPDWTAYPGGETLAMLDARMRTALAELEGAGHSEVVAVGHGFSGTLLLKAWLGLPLLPYIAFNLGPASVSEFRINEFSEPCIERLNSRCAAGLDRFRWPDQSALHRCAGGRLHRRACCRLSVLRCASPPSHLRERCRQSRWTG